MVKNPRKPKQPLVRKPEDIIPFQDPLWRIHKTKGDFALPWNALRAWGPNSTCRFDPHPAGAPAVDPHYAVMYAGTDPLTAVIEVSQERRVVDTRTGDPALTSWTPTRPLCLLDLMTTDRDGTVKPDNWCLRNGASASLPSATKDICRNWAHAIRTQFPDVDGLHTPSTMTGAPTVVLFSRASNSFPGRPGFSRFLDSDEMVAVVTGELTAHEISFKVV